MENLNTGTYDMYRDISARTNGEIYIGIIGAVRTGKSSFIKRFMELMVLPFMENENSRQRAIDEMPQAAQGKTIMTTEPKFIPKDAAEIMIGDDTKVKVRLIDCVGYMVDGATGHMENGSERMVKTPWYDYEIPFTKAAEIGTKKVINDHATIGIVVTADGSFTDIPRESYAPAEEETVKELKKIGKPFVIVLNTTKPYSEETVNLAQELQKKYGVSVFPVNCDQLRKEDVNAILKGILYEFPVVSMNFYVPKWTEMLPYDHYIKQDMIRQAKKVLKDITYIKDLINYNFSPQAECVESVRLKNMSLESGTADITMELAESYYYQNISELTGVEVNGEYQLIRLVKELADMRKVYETVGDALASVRAKGYGVVCPKLSDIQMEDPVLMKHGNKFGVRMKATAPSIHLIRANIETEIAPIVGSEEQANDLIRYIKEGQDTEAGVWNTNIFGKTIGELMEDGIRNKITMMDDESQMKLQDTMQKIVNDSNGGLVCIII
ncbi:MAG: stage IV sporulation protein A [Roseburia sp.]